jgi:hypothetical protein
MSAAEAQMKTSNFVDEMINVVIDVLSEYERKCHSKKTVAKRMIIMAEAGRKYRFRVREGLQVTFTSFHTNTDPCWL